MLAYLCSAGCKPEQHMMYAGSKNKLVQTVEMSKVGEPSVPTSDIDANSWQSSTGVQLMQHCDWIL